MKNRPRILKTGQQASSSSSTIRTKPWGMWLLAMAIFLGQGLWMGRQIRWTLSQYDDHAPACSSSSSSSHALVLSSPQRNSMWKNSVDQHQQQPLNSNNNNNNNIITRNANNNTARLLPKQLLLSLPRYQDHRPLTLFYPSNETYQGPRRIFPVWRHAEFPCGSGEEGYHRSPTPVGFLYMKEFKTGSSTLAGISLRIARNVAARRNNMTFPCTVRCAHLRARKYAHRQTNASFLWSVLREPTTRLVSKFYHFAVSREKLSPTVEHMQEYFRRQRNRAYDRQYYLKTLSLRDINPRTDDIGMNQYVEEILLGFDFIGITERMDESLVVLQLLLHLETGDMLYLSAKESGSWEYFPLLRSCKYIMKYAVTPAMKDWFRSDEWYEYVRGDVLLYKAANKSLDRTIWKLGPDRVQRALLRFRWAQRLAEEQCATTTRYPCTSGGERNTVNDCLWQDMGCGYACLDQVAAQLKTSNVFNALPEIG